MNMEGLQTMRMEDAEYGLDRADRDWKE